MKLKSDVNLNHAFEMLKDALRESKELADKETELPGVNYAEAYGTLRGTTEVILTYVEDKESEDDLPGGVFGGPGTSD